MRILYIKLSQSFKVIVCKVSYFDLLRDKLIKLWCKPLLMTPFDDNSIILDVKSFVKTLDKVWSNHSLNVYNT